MNVDLEQLVLAISLVKPKRKPVMIAIDGFGGSGKTTLAKNLHDALVNAEVISLDDFIIRDRINTSSTDETGFDRQRLEVQVLLPATSGKSVQYQQLIWSNNGLSEPRDIPATDFLIIEGISSCHPDIADYFDYRIWVNTPVAVAKARGQDRDANNENADRWDLWAENDTRYQERYHPERLADFIIAGF